MTLREAMAAVRSNPRSALAWSELGDALVGEGQLEKARESYQRALQLDPLCAGAQSGLAATLVQPPSETSAPPVEEAPRSAFGFVPAEVRAAQPAAPSGSAGRRTRHAVPPWPEKPGRTRMMIGMLLLVLLPGTCLCAALLALARLI